MAEEKRSMQEIKKDFESIGSGEHICCIYKNKGERVAMVIPFMAVGLERNEKCAYIIDESSKDEIIREFKDNGIDIDKYLASGQLEFFTKEQAYLKDGLFDPDRMIGLLKDAEKAALNQGYAGLRITGEMTWVFAGLPGTERLFEYEAKLNYFFPNSKSCAICQYNEERFNPEVLLNVIHTHPKAFIYRYFCDNHYYIPPDEFITNVKGALSKNLYGKIRDDLILRLKIGFEYEKAPFGLGQHYEMQEIVNKVLKISLQNISLIEMLEEIIDLLTGIPWLVLEKKGAIFLVEGEPSVLVLKAQRNLAKELCRICAQVPFGRCLCGLAAASGEVIFSDHLDEHHHNSYEGMLNHGHYCVPLKTSHGILGVLNLYVKERHLSSESEKKFLVGIADIISGVIERKKIEEELRDAEEEWSRTFNAISDLVFIEDLNSVIIKANKAFLEAFKIKEEDVIGRKCYEIVHKRLASWPNCPFQQLLNDGKTHTEEVNDPVLGVPLLITVAPLLNKNGDIVGAVHLAKDISDLKQAESQMKEKIHDLEVFNKAAVDRELKMVELKKKIAELEGR